jgi:polygalacturonase
MPRIETDSVRLSSRQRRLVPFQYLLEKFVLRRAEVGKADRIFLSLHEAKRLVGLGLKLTFELMDCRPEGLSSKETNAMKITRKDFLLRTASLLAPLDQSTMPGSTAANPDETTNGKPNIFSVRQFGARGNGKNKDTRAIQAAIDAAGSAGGTVYFPAGEYLSGTLQLRSFIRLYLESGATLLASTDESDFDRYEKLEYNSFTDEESTYYRYALVRGEELQNISLMGTGVIDGNRSKRGGPKPISLKSCREVSIRDLTLRNSPNYTIAMLGCDHVNIDGVTILNGFADGIDPDCCRFVRIANCYIESADDAICPKTSFALGSVRSTENVLVTNCILTTESQALKLGSDSCGDFRNIIFSNCSIFGQRNKWGHGPIAGIAIESVDGGNINGLVISNITMDDARTAIFVRLGARGRGQQVPASGTIQNISISNVTANKTSLACSITGLPGQCVRDLTLSDIRISVTGGGIAEQASKEIPELDHQYPRSDMFGELPAYGLFCRHIKNLMVNGLHFSLDDVDQRPAIVAVDADGFDLVSLRAFPPSGNQPVILLHDVREVLMSGARALPRTKKFLALRGQGTRNVHLVGNDLCEADLPFDINEDVPPGALLEHGNLLSGLR